MELHLPLLIISLNRNIVNKLILILSFLTISGSIFGQNTTIKGLVKDANNSSISFANVAIEGTTLGTTTDKNGNYKIGNIPNGEYVLVVSFIGYKTTKKAFTVNQQSSINLDVTLAENVTELQEVQIVSNIGATEIKPQKITYSVDKLASQAGGTAGDVLKNMPSVAMGGSPNHNRDIRYRGLGNGYTTVLINGRNAGATGNNRETVLDMIPASQIERIEILSNPSADVQSDGINGVVNIVLKKGVPIPGSSGNIGFIVDSQDGYNGSLQFTETLKKLQFTVGLDRLKRNANKTDVEALTKFENDGSAKERSDINKDELKGFENTGARFNVRYAPNDKLSFQAEYLYGDQNETKSKDELNLTFKPDNSFKKGTARIETEDKGFNFHNMFFGTTANIGNNGVLEMGINANLSEEEKNKLRNDFKTNSDGVIEELDGPKRQSEYELKSKDAYFPEVSYRHNFKNLQIRTGYQGYLTSFSSDRTISNFNFDDNIFETNADNKNNFSVQENVHAFYALSKWIKNKWSIEGGLRYEVVDIRSESSVDSIPKGRSQYNLPLPNVHILYNLTEKSYFTFSFGRRLRRPAYQDLNPFVEIKDLTEIKRGNPALKPETAWAYELGYLRKFKNFDVGVNTFYRDINDLIQKNKFEDAQGIIVEEPVNLNGARVYGIEFLTSAKIATWWNVNLNYSRFYSDIKDADSDFDGDALKDQTQWTGKIISDFKLPKELSLQIAGNIVGPKVSTQKTENTIWSFDVGLEKRFLTNGSFILRVVDVFDTLKKTRLETTGSQVKERIEETPGQIVSAGLRWNF